MKQHPCLITAACTLLAMGSGHAAITHVDADTGNTTLSDGTAYTPTGSVNNTDNQWSSRGFGYNATVYTANDNNANPGEDAPELRTTITGLSVGQEYEIFVYYWTGGNDAPTGNQQWDIQAGLTSGSLATILAADGTNLGHASTGVDPSAYFTNVPAPAVADSDRRLREYSLGTAVANGSGAIEVFIDDNPGNVNRTWYDGVGFSAVPEPSVTLLGGLGLLGLLRRRRA